MLGIITAIGGFVDVGNIATAGEAGSKFGFSLVWAVLLGTVVVIFLIEMVGRMAAMGDKAYADIIREKFGIKFALLPLSADLIANFLLLSAEIGGAGVAAYPVTPNPFPTSGPAGRAGPVVLLLPARLSRIQQAPRRPRPPTP